MSSIGRLPCVWVELFTEDMRWSWFYLATLDTDSLYLMESCFRQKRRWRETLLYFTTILYHMALVTPGHNCQEDGYPITAAVIGTLGGPNQYHIPCLLCNTDLLCYLNLQLLSGSGERRSHFISSLVHGHAVQHRSTAAISKITETVWKMRRLKGIMEQNMKLQLCPKNKVSITNQASIRQATSLKDIKSDIIKLQNSPQTQNQIDFMFLFIVIHFYAVHYISQILLSEVLSMCLCVSACVL